MKSIMDEYTAKHTRSRALFEEAREIFPSGVTHDTRRVKPFSIFVRSGSGARKCDVDGNEYICYVMGHGALILGHSHPLIVSAVCKQIHRGTHLGCNTELELCWAGLVKRLMPSIEMISFHSTGTEATLMAIRLARAYTGKNKIVKFRDHFHGWHDYVIAESGKYSSAGIPEATSSTVMRLPAGEIKKMEELLRADHDIAGVILEPTGAGMGCLPLNPKFLLELREVTSRYGVLLIFDEVVTGFRLSPGGAQERFHVKPDLTTLGKILGGGLPAGAVGGRREIIEKISFHDDPEWNSISRVSHPGTFNANPLSAAAGVKCLELIEHGTVNSQADARASSLKEGFNRILNRGKIPGVAYGLASLLWVVFDTQYGKEGDIYSLPHQMIKQSLNSEKAQRFKQALLNQGVDIMGTGEFIVSAVHGEKEIEDTLDAFERALHAMKSEGLF